MDPRLIALMQMAQRAKQPVRRFSDGDFVDYDFGGFDAGDFNVDDFDASSFDIGDLGDLGDLSNLGDLTGGSDAGETIDMLTRGGAGEDVNIEDLDLNRLARIGDIGGFGAYDPAFIPMGDNRLSPVDQFNAIMKDLAFSEGRLPSDQYNRMFPIGSTEASKHQAAAEDLMRDAELGRFAAPGYGDLGQFLGGAGEAPAASEEAERADRYGGLYEQAMSGLTDAMQGGTYNAARDSQAANEYLERVMGVPRSEIDEAYASGAPRFVNLSNFQGGKSFATGRDDTATNKTAGTEVKYDSKGNLVDTKTGTILDKAPPGTTTKTIQDIIKQYTGATQTGAKTGQQSNLASLLPLLLIMLMMNRQSGSASNATIPALSASQTQTPYGAIQQAAGYRPGQGGITYFNPIQYAPKMAGGGIADLAMMKQGGRLLHGPGDGVSDSIPATIGGQQPARLARGEYVIDARTVAELGNGSTDAGAERLDEMRQRVLSKRKQAKMGQDTRAYKHLPA